MHTLQTIINFFHVNSGLDVEIIKIVFVLSLIISLFVYHKFHNIPVGIVAPGMILLLLGYPNKLFLVLAISALVYVSAIFLQKYIFSHTILASREKVLLFVLLSTIYSLLAFLLFNSTLDLLTTGTIGIVLPAMISDSLTKDNKWQSMKSLGIATFFTIVSFVFIKLLGTILFSASYKQYLDYLYPTKHILDNVSIFAMYILFGIATVYNFIIYRYAKLKSVGLLLGAYLGLLFFQPEQLLFIAVITIISYLIIASIHKHVMIYGYRMFTLSAIIVAFIYSIVERLAFYYFPGTFYSFVGLNIAGILIGSLLVSEAVEVGYKKATLVTFLMAIIMAGSLSAMQLISPYFKSDFKVSVLIQRTYAREGTLKKTETKKTEAKKTIQKPSKYTEVAKTGDSQTILARNAVRRFEKINKIQLQDYQRLYLETNLVKNHFRNNLYVGDSITYLRKEISSLITKSKKLNSISIAKWKSYNINYNILPK